MMSLLLVVTCQVGSPSVPPPSEVQRLFEAGRYQAVLDAVAAEEAPPPEARYLAAQSALKLTPPDLGRARSWLDSLQGDDEDAWTFIARSAGLLAESAGSGGREAASTPPGPVERAIEAAREAVTRAPESLFAHYQLGLALATGRRWPEAAAAFEQAVALNPRFAYAHYYAGLAFYQIKRVDKMADAFERFLKLAPGAPERPAVESLLRTLRR